MKKEASGQRLEQGNQMVAALKAETHRGKACVGDAMIDELFKELFVRRLIDRKSDVAQVLSDGQPLGNHGGRLRVAYLLGWIGPETYADCRNIRRIRNHMAHQLDVDTFDHEQVRDLVDGLQAPRHAQIDFEGQRKRLNLTRREDRFLYAALVSVMRCWQLLDHSKHVTAGVDVPIVPLPNPPHDIARKRLSK